MKIIGITGPTGAGKTTALNALTALGAAVIDCDAVYHDLTVHSKPMLDELRRRYGDSIFDEQGALQRKALGAIVFSDEKSLDDLNAITHHYVNEAVDGAITRAREEGRPAAAVDAIALLESDLIQKCHCTVAVTAPDEVRVQRIMARDGISEEYARMRINAQKPSAWFEERCDYYLRNDGDDREAFFEEAKVLFEQIISQGGNT